MSRVIALLGAESTGKTTLAAQLQAALGAQGLDVGRVDEALREFCDTHRRTPRQDEQAGIAAEQTRRIAAAAATHELVVADTTALMIAVYSDTVFADRSLYDGALAAHRGTWLTLLTALDLPWQADGLQRDGPQVREPVDARLRAALQRGGIGWGLVTGRGERRLDNALQAVRHTLGHPGAEDEAIANPAGRRGWQGRCERCGDPDCERHGLFGRLGL